MFTYIIWSPQGEKPPTVTYNRRWKAEYEAKRLSQAHPNQVFHVCKIKSATVAGQSAYFGKWRPNKSGSQKRKDRQSRWIDNTVFDDRNYGHSEKQPWEQWKPSESVNLNTAVSEADLMDDNLERSLGNLGKYAQETSDLMYRLGMAAVTMR